MENQTGNAMETCIIACYRKRAVIWHEAILYPYNGESSGKEHGNEMKTRGIWGNIKGPLWGLGLRDYGFSV